MNDQRRAAIGMLMIAAALVVVHPMAAWQTEPSAAPTKKDPLRFSAFNVALQAGVAGTTQIAIERWSTEEERQKLLELVVQTTEGERGQRKLLQALQRVKPRVGFIRTSRSLGWDLRYARENIMADGTRQIVIATDKPVSFAAAATGARTMDYPFTFIEMRIKPNEKGEGRMLVATSISTQGGQLQLENYGQEPVRLTSITQEPRKSSN